MPQLFGASAFVDDCETIYLLTTADAVTSQMIIFVYFPHNRGGRVSASSSPVSLFFSVTEL